jgi:hypothetical protein
VSVPFHFFNPKRKLLPILCRSIAGCGVCDRGITRSTSETGFAENVFDRGLSGRKKGKGIWKSGRGTGKKTGVAQWTRKGKGDKGKEMGGQGIKDRG